MDRNAHHFIAVAVCLAAIPGGTTVAWAARPHAAVVRQLPVLARSAPAPAGACYFDDHFVVQLSHDASRAAAVQTSIARAAAAGAASVSGANRPRLARLGLPGIDAAAAALGAWFEPEFAGESPPPASEPRTDFAAFFLVHVPPGTDLMAAIERFRADHDVASVSPIAQVPLAMTPNDSLWSISWWLEQASQHDIHASAAWDVTTGDTSIVVAVLDSGILRMHPDLGGTIAGSPGQMWTNWAEANGVPGVDDDGDGYIDDTWGWDFVHAEPVGGAPAGEDVTDEDNDPNDFLGHGTEVAGLIGALTNNAIGMSGACWNLRLMAVRVACAVNGGGGAVDMSDAAQGILYAARHGASVINCSFSTVSQPDLQAATDEAVRSGATLVIAAGNTDQSHDLADRGDVVAVGATDINDQVAFFSNTGSFVDLSAPGLGVISTSVMHVTSDSVGLREPSYTVSLAGTSFSTPLVAGGAALIQALQRARGEHPLTPMGVQLRLRETADDISALNPGVSGYGTGRLNLTRALTEISGSAAFRAGAPAVGPAVALPGTSGRSTLAFVTSDAQLIELSVAGDTLVRAALPAAPARQLAAADLGGALGIGLFVGLVNGQVAGFDSHGNSLPGWPRGAPTAQWPMSGGPALGDLDGDGAPEIACASGDGTIYAWKSTGVAVPGFPAMLNDGTISLPVALAPIDAVAGDEIVAVTDAGHVHVLGAGGVELPGWPKSVTGAPAAPLVTTLGTSARPMIVVAAGNQVHAFEADGTERWTATLPGNVISDPAAADLDQDGFDEILVPTIAPSTLTVIDTAGVVWSAPGFPIALAAAPAGPVVAGPLLGGGAPAALLMVQGGLAAYDRAANPLARFPEPGGAGPNPVIAELDGDGASEVAAGSGPDSLFYVYDAGPGTYGTPSAMWPAPRANDARTGSRLGASALPPRDDIPPAMIADLSAGFVAPDSVVLHWTAPGNDGMSGTAARYQLKVTGLASDVTNFSSGVRTDLPAPDPAGAAERFALAVNAPAARLYLCLRALDPSGNAAAPSNVVVVLLPVSDGTQVTTLGAFSVADSTVMLRWRAPGAALSGYEVRGAHTPLDDASWSAAPLQRAHAPAAGAMDSLRIGGLEPGASWWFAMRALPAGGAPGPISNVAAITVPMTGWLAHRAGLAIAPHTQPSRLPVQLDWQGVPPATNAQIELFDLAGRKLRAFPLERGRFGGSVQWNGRDSQQRAVPAGLYFARLNCGSIHAQTRVVLLP